MNAFGRFVVVTASTVLAGPAAFAMDIRQFEAMVGEDQHAYIADLVWGAAILLEQDCKPQAAAQVRKLFIHEDGTRVYDPLEGTMSLGRRLVQMGKRAAEHPEQASRIRVDDALRATLRDKGITLPERFAAIDREFKPKGAPPVRKPGDDAVFGTRDEVEDIFAMQSLQLALDERNNSEIATDKRLRGVCKNAQAKTGASAAPPNDGTPSVAGFEPSWIGRTMKVRGTVSRFVQKNVNGEPYVYLYFKERPDSTVVACTRDDRWLLNVLGVDDFKSVVGRTLEFNGRVDGQPCAQHGASLWIWERSNARLVGGSTR